MIPADQCRPACRRRRAATPDGVPESLRHVGGLAEPLGRAKPQFVQTAESIGGLRPCGCWPATPKRRLPAKLHDGTWTYPLPSDRGAIRLSATNGFPFSRSQIVNTYA